MKGVKFGSLHSFYEWGLILSEKEMVAVFRQRRKEQQND